MKMNKTKYDSSIADVDEKRCRCVVCTCFYEFTTLIKVHSNVYAQQLLCMGMMRIMLVAVFANCSCSKCMACFKKKFNKIEAQTN